MISIVKSSDQKGGPRIVTMVAKSGEDGRMRRVDAMEICPGAGSTFQKIVVDKNWITSADPLILVPVRDPPTST